MLNYIYSIRQEFIFKMAKIENKDFFQRVFEIVRRIPCGKVTTYGAIGKYLGLKSSARMVGWAVNSLKYEMDYPCHRVVNRNGELTGKMHFASPSQMRELLEAEGIEFLDERVNMKLHFWEPNQ
jgi:methylated-DNA-protein-cysteine methyltransferase-like protein